MQGNSIIMCELCCLVDNLKVISSWCGGMQRNSNNLCGNRVAGSKTTQWTTWRSSAAGVVGCKGTVITNMWIMLQGAGLLDGQPEVRQQLAWWNPGQQAAHQTGRDTAGGLQLWRHSPVGEPAWLAQRLRHPALRGGLGHQGNASFSFPFLFFNSSFRDAMKFPEFCYLRSKGVSSSANSLRVSFSLTSVSSSLLPACHWQTKTHLLSTKHSFCHNKSMFAVTKCLPWQNIFIATTGLSRQTQVLSQQTCFLWQK